MKNLRRVILAVLVASCLMTALGWTQEQDSSGQLNDSNDQPARKDPPGRTARLQYMSGSVSIQPSGTADWVAGSLNRPLTNSDNVWTDKSSRAELNSGTGLLRMGDETSLTLTNVSSNSVQVQLHQGTLNVHVRHLVDGEIYEIDTPNMAFTVQKSGDYRFDVDPNGDATVVTVRKGEGDATGQGPGVRVKADQQIRFSNGTSMTHSDAEAPPYDGFDSWCAVRDKRLDSSLSARYVAPGTVGYEDLDDNGTWREVPPYGPVWVPTAVAPGWAPYAFGHWVWIAPWGWTWVDDAPWGFAPFHYGRWVSVGGFWGWAPGPVYVQPYYAPALVAWFGGPGWGVSFGFGFGGGFGWCPLGWHEPFFPWYGGSRYYFHQVNVNIVNVDRFYGHPPNRFGEGGFHYANMRAFTAVPARTLANGMAVHGTTVRVSGRELANAPMGHANVAPTRNAMLGPHAGEPAAMPGRTGMRPVVSRMGSPAMGHSGGNPMAASGSRPFAGRTESSPLTPSRMIPHGPENAARGVPSPSFRGVPRPPNASTGRPALSVSGPSGAQIARNVPRPPVGFNSRGITPTSIPRGGNSSIPQGARNHPTTAVPRPTGPVQPVRNYNRMGGNGYGGNRGSYGGSPQYSRPQSSSPRYNLPGYSSPHYNTSPSYRSSAPSYRTPSYGGGGSYHGGGTPSNHGGGGGGSYHGGGSSGHASSGSHSGHR
jgi:hypothetical protein